MTSSSGCGASSRSCDLTAGWSAADAERYLLSRELFGMRFGLDRMRRLTAALGSPQERFDSIHVVGTNGKSSTTRMLAAILRRHGLRTGAYVSPHLVSFAERIRIDDRDLPGDRFAAAVERAATAAADVERDLEPDDRVTQFEALTAAAYDELARAGVEVAVVEAGLGGRYDATNVIPSRVQVLTNVGLDHTRWLGSTVAAIAAEKLAVVREGGILVVGAGLHPDALACAHATAGERRARLVEASADAGGVELAARGAFQRRNFALAQKAAAVYLADRGRGTLTADTVRAAAAATVVPGRFQVVGDAPATVLDGAHNAAGIDALVESLTAFAAGRRVVGLVSVLNDKDAGEMLRRLLPACDEVVFCASANPRAIPAAALASLGRQLGVAAAHAEPSCRAGLALARRLARPEGVVVATGSISLVADLVRPAGSGPASRF